MVKVWQLMLPRQCEGLAKKRVVYLLKLSKVHSSSFCVCACIHYRHVTGVYMSVFCEYLIHAKFVVFFLRMTERITENLYYIDDAFFVARELLLIMVVISGI